MRVRNPGGSEGDCGREPQAGHCMEKAYAVRRVRCGVAMSLDGFIAGPPGGKPTGDHPAIDFRSLLAQFDTLLMEPQDS